MDFKSEVQTHIQNSNTEACILSAMSDSWSRKKKLNRNKEIHSEDILNLCINNLYNCYLFYFSSLSLFVLCQLQCQFKTLLKIFISKGIQSHRPEANFAL